MKCYMEICYTYEKRDRNKSFLPLVAIVEVEVVDGELIKHLADKALNKIQEKYSENHIYMIDYKYLGHTVEIIRQEVKQNDL